MSCVTLAVTIS